MSQPLSQPTRPTTSRPTMVTGDMYRTDSVQQKLTENPIAQHLAEADQQAFQTLWGNDQPKKSK